MKKNTKNLTVFSYVNKNTLINAWYYFKGNGLKAFVKKAFFRLRHPNTHFEYSFFCKETTPTPIQLQKQKEMAKQLKFQGLISILIPAFNTEKTLLVMLIESLKAQTYENFEVIIADASDAGQTRVKETVSEYATQDSRFKYLKSEQNLGISGNTNTALRISKGEFIGLCDHDDELPPWALFEVAKAISENPRAEVLYTDEDKCNEDSSSCFFDPHFKSDFNPEMLTTYNYITHFTIIKRSLFDKIGEFDPQHDGAQDHDIVLKATEVAVHDELLRLKKYREVLKENKDISTLSQQSGLFETSVQKLLDGCFISEKVIHIPIPCYHWRTLPESTALNPEAKLYAYKAGCRAVKKHYDRTGIDYKDVIITPDYGHYRTLFNEPDENVPLISIIIPNKDHVKDLNKCIASIIQKSTYRNLEFIIIENNSEDEKTFSFYNTLQEKSDIPIKVVTYKGPFNYSAINNFGVQYASGTFLLLMNNDIELIEPDSINELYQYAKRDGIGAVGPMLLFPNDTVQSAGIVVGIGGTAASNFQRTYYKDITYMLRMSSVVDYSALTAACLMLKKSDFDDIGGFDESFPVAFNDVDLCLRLRQLGLRNVYTPYARFYHYESKTRGYEDTPEKNERFQKESLHLQEKWIHFMKNLDPYYNPNLTLRACNFNLRDLNCEHVGEPHPLLYTEVQNPGDSSEQDSPGSDH